MKKFTKIALIVASFVLVIALSVGGTIAWLTATTDEVTNTFTKGEIEITLDEADVLENDPNNPGQDNDDLGQPIKGAGRVKENSYQAIPGNTYYKDPTVKVVEGSEKCWLFVEFDESADIKQYYNYVSTLSTNNGWTPGDGTSIPTNVWWRVVEENAEVRSWVLLEELNESGEEVYHLEVLDSVNATNMAQAEAAVLSWNAYAVQYANLTVEEAWAEVAPAPVTPAPDTGA